MAEMTQAELKSLFKQCAFFDGSSWSKDHYWKLPLRVVVAEDEISAMKEAILHFVGGHETPVDLERGMYCITSKGYYHYIGA